MLLKTNFVWAALDSFTNTRCRNIPSKIPGRKLQPPSGASTRWVCQGCRAAIRKESPPQTTQRRFVLAELKMHRGSGEGSGRKYPANSLHWSTPAEPDMVAEGVWHNQRYDACSLQGARRKKQRDRHNIEEIRCWPNMQCEYTHTTYKRHPALNNIEHQCRIYVEVSTIEAWLETRVRSCS